MDETVVIWLTAGILITVVFIPYLLKFRRSQKAASARRDEAVLLGTTRAMGQFPMVDRSLCIGCGSCVDACPEGDVLAVVWGKAQVVNGPRCVGHGYCEKACPVGALKVGLGDVRTRPDIPILTEQHETTVPGIFIAGELSGVSLIRHAVSHGRLVAEEISRRVGSGARVDGLYDVVIAGAGPAGLTAALCVQERGLRCIVIDQYEIGGAIRHYPRRKLVMTQPVEIPCYGRLTRDEYSKEELMAIWQEVTSNSAVELRTREKLTGVLRRGGVFSVTAESGFGVEGKFVVLALGRRGTPRRLGVPGEELPKVMYQLTDAQSYQGKHMLVVGGGDSAVEAAIGLARQEGNTVSLSYRKNRFFRIKKKNEQRIEQMMRDGRIHAYFDSEVTRIDKDSVTLSAPSRDTELPNDYVIVQAGGIPPFDMLKSFGIAFGGESLSLAEQDERCHIEASHSA